MSSASGPRGLTPAHSRRAPTGMSNLSQSRRTRRRRHATSSMRGHSSIDGRRPARRRLCIAVSRKSMVASASAPECALAFIARWGCSATAVYLRPHRVHRNQRSALPDCSSSSTRSTRWHFMQGGNSDHVRLGVWRWPSPLRRDGCRGMACPFEGMAQVSAGGTSQTWLAAEALRKADTLRQPRRGRGIRRPSDREFANPPVWNRCGLQCGLTNRITLSPIELGQTSHGGIDEMLEEWLLNTEDLRRLARRAVERMREG